ncbi:STAS domain-containing protein [Candidatus Margulisiibacteriota bacterium]
MIELFEDQTNNCITITIYHDFEAHDEEKINQIKEKITESDSKKIMLNCEHCHFITSSGIESLLNLRNECLRLNKTFEMGAISEELVTIFKMTRNDVVLIGVKK